MAMTNPYSFYSNPYQSQTAAPWANQNQQQQSGSPFSGFNNISKLFNSGSSSSGNSIFGGVQGSIRNSINQAGTSLGFAPASTYYTATGALPWQVAGGVANPAAAGMSGVATGGTTLSSTLGAAGIGAGIGGFLNSKNPMAGSIGGALGGAIGNAIAPGVGGLVGGALGGIASKVFGGGRPKAKVSIFSNANDAQGNLGSAYVKGKTLSDDYGTGVFNKVSPYVSELAKELGPLKSMNIVGGTHSKWGGDFISAVPIEQANQENVPKEFLRNYNSQDPEGFNNAISQVLTDMGRYSGYSQEQIAGALQRIKKKEILGTIGSGGNGQILIPEAKKPEQSFDDFLKNYKASGAAKPDQPAQ